MAINRELLVQELVLTSGNHFTGTPEIIDQSIETAISIYSDLNILDKVFPITTDITINSYRLPRDYQDMIALYTVKDLYASLYNAGFIEWDGTFYYQNTANTVTDYLTILMDKIEYFRYVDTALQYLSYKVDAATRSLVFTNLPDPNAESKMYLLHYKSRHSLLDITPDHHEYIFKLASSALLQRQAMSLSRVTSVNGPGVNSSFVSPQLMMDMAKALKSEVVDALNRSVPERG